MTKEEAIKILKAIRVYECYPKSASEETKEAIDMAIKALTEPINCIKCKHYYETEDETSVHGYCKMDTTHTNLKKEAIRKLQKQKAKYLEEWVDFSGVAEAYDMAIEALKQPSDEMQLLDDGTLKVKVANVSDIKRVMLMDDNVIYDSYYPDRPKGEWKCMADCGVTECDQCGWNVEEYVGDYNFCPNCGAKMCRQ